ncbi:MAG TPA: division/cell wall cluster transcriptional repressor MraZ [Planctomycetota bacterium]
MEAVFTGDSIHTLDPKHRVFVPKRFQDELARDANGQQIAVLTRGFEGCLFLFSKPGFARVLERMTTQPFGGEQLRTMQRLFFSNVHETPLDSSGRVLLPEKLRKYASIDKEVVMVGVADRAEVWDRARWERFQAEKDDDFDGLDVVLVGGGGPNGPPPNGGGPAR